MLYAIIDTGDKQFRVENGLILDIPLFEAEENSAVVFDNVLLCSNGEETCVGAPTVDGAKVKATCLGETKGEKLTVFKIKRRKKYRKKTGHRQTLLSVKIDEIVAPIKDLAPVETEANPVEPEKSEPAEAEESND